MQCPLCQTKDPGVYVGLHKVECINSQCDHFVQPIIGSTKHPIIVTFTIGRNLGFENPYFKDNLGVRFSPDQDGQEFD